MVKGFNLKWGLLMDIANNIQSSMGWFKGNHAGNHGVFVGTGVLFPLIQGVV